ncbi:Rha family transcriptional regulator [Providencia sp. CIM-Carb-044]|uniref:Rha family transcriptional regulator n=1 Tax=Providencia sp. CIM-Carb-044 TaxID=3096048 RepID=UPI0029DB0208|nr:Rha family transcriptional regulator [Providencia sp. CIM-Carb-044]MDX7424256.1 Rha family transcriptional regulator [Providencia sp. CIM-Carb-044]
MDGYQMEKYQGCSKTEKPIAATIGQSQTKPEGKVSMNELTLASNETNVTMSSREIAELTGKKHADICRDIRVMLAEMYEGNEKDYIRNADLLYLTNHSVSCVHYDESNPNAWEYLLDRYHSEILVTGYDVKRRAAVIKRWYDLETGKVNPMAALNDPEFLRSTLLTYSEKVIALEHTNKELSNKVECMSNLFKEGMTPTQFCKMLNGVNTQQVQMWLAERNWLYNESKSGKNVRWRVASYARDKYMTENQSEINPHGYEPFIKYQPVLLKKGAKRIYDLYLAGELPMKKNWDGLFTHDKEFKAVA